MKVEITLPLEKETKGALLYRDKEIAARDPLYVLDGVYVRKAGVAMQRSAGRIGWPQAIKITIEEVES